MSRHKQKTDVSLGKSLVNARGANKANRQQKKRGAPAALGDEDAPHMADTPVVTDSIVEESSVQEFMARAQLADMRFTADRHAAHMMSQTTASNFIGYRIQPSNLDAQKLQETYGDRLKIPRRPERSCWNDADELHRVEQESFLVWRRALAALEQEDGIQLTPFEKNLEIWRQLWRTLERSAVVLQIVDARNPLLFRSQDLESYIAALGKQHVLLVNKADLLSQAQRRLWAEYFAAEGISAWFWSATVDDEPEISPAPPPTLEEKRTRRNTTHTESETDSSDSVESDHEADVSDGSDVDMPETDLLSRDELVDKLKSMRSPDDTDAFVVGMVGYPNVGKSSTINRILGVKKVAVSATPGKTRHLQTLIVEEGLTLCDCPGLVLPSLAMSKAEMLCNAILPVDQLNDPHPACSLVCGRLPRRLLEQAFGVMLPAPADHEPADRPPSSAELLTSVAFVRGFFSSKGIPDQSRAARFVLKSVVEGRCVLAVAPPNASQHEYDALRIPVKVGSSNRMAAAGALLDQLNKRNLLETDASNADRLDKEFFDAGKNAAHIKGRTPGGKMTGNKHHGNRKSKEKARRMYKHLDM